jgi:hypothetical protein
MSNVTQQEVNVFLDVVRSVGVTNMWGAGRYVEDEFKVSRHEARAFLLEWMRTFGERRAAGEVVE